jgi:Tfp pilus assembly protein PilF
MGKQRTSNRSEGGLGRRPARAWVPKTLHVMLVLAALAAIIYGNSLRNELVFDDNMLISYNPSIRNLALYPKIFGWEARRTVPLAPDRGVTHRPVRTAVMALEYALFGRHPAGYRAVNILLHILNGALVFGLLRRLLGRPWPALGAAVLFVVHPIQTEAVAYIAGQRDVLFTTFYLLGFLSFVRYRATGRPRDLGLAGLAYLLSLLTKEMAITLPLLCVAYDLVRALPGADAAVPPPLPQALRDGLRVTVAQSTRLYLLGAALLAAVLAYFVLIANPSRQHELWGGGLGPTLNTSARILVVYLKQLVLPLTLNADYSYNAFPVSTSVADPRGLFALLLLGGLGYGLVRLLPLDRWLTFGGLWFFLTLLPVSQLIPHHELMAEHYLYLPSAGLFLTVGVLAERVLAPGRHRAALAAAFALVVVLLGVRTVVRNRDWRDSLTLWSKTVQTAPGSARAHANLAAELFETHDPSGARRELERSLEIRPTFGLALASLGMVVQWQGQIDEAIALYHKVDRGDAHYGMARLNLGRAYLKKGMPADALREFRAAARYRRYAKSAMSEFNRLAEELFRAGSFTEAQAALETARDYARNDLTIRRNLALVYSHQGRWADAQRELEAAERLEPSSPDIQMELGTAYARGGLLTRAEAALRGSLRLRPGNPDALNLLGAVLNDQDRLAEATEVLLLALRLRPDDPDAHYNLGVNFAKGSQPRDAQKEFKTALRLRPKFPLAQRGLSALLRQQGRTGLAERESRPTADQEKARRSGAPAALGPLAQ